MKSNKSLRHSAVAFAAGSFLLFGAASCNQAQKEEANAETAEVKADAKDAYSDFKDYVSSVESDVEYKANMADADWDAKKAEWKTEYDTKVAAVDQEASEFDDARKQEYEALKTRYNNAMTQRDTEYQTWKQNNQSAGSVSKVDMSIMDATKIPAYTASDIRMAYEQFVKHVQANRSNYSNEDWKTVETYWDKLDDHKNAIQSQLSDKDKWEIAKAKTQYQTIKNTSKAGNTAQSVGSSAKDAGKKVGNEAEQAGKAVGDAAKSGAQKVKGAFEKDNK